MFKHKWQQLLRSFCCRTSYFKPVNTKNENITKNNQYSFKCVVRGNKKS